MRFVPVKTLDQQGQLLVHRARQGFIEQRTATLNRIRGLLSKFGVVLPLKTALVVFRGQHQMVHFGTSCTQAIVQATHTRTVFDMTGLALQDLAIRRMCRNTLTRPIPIPVSHGLGDFINLN